MKEIKVGWAILTKQPEDAEDYQVLAYSAGELNAGSYHDLMHRWMTGEVPYEPKFRIPATPWYQFGIIKEPIRQVVLQQKWTGYSDYRNRPVLETICLLLPFEKLAEVSCGYKQMVDIFEQEGVKAFFTERMGEISRGIGKTEYEEISILLPEREEVSEWVRRAIKEVGAEISMRAADLLLRNPLMIYAGGQVKSVEERVKWLDAVMAMLPYGLRADCPVSLWASSSARHGMRLYWGDMVREGHGYIEVSKQGKENGEKVKLGSYMGELELIWGRVSQEEILNYLAEQSEERSFQNPIPDDFLYGLNSALIVLNRINREKEKGGLSTETYTAAKEILEAGSLNCLTVEEQFEFIIKGIIPKFEIEQIGHLIYFWNKNLSEWLINLIEKQSKKIIVSEEIKILYKFTQLLLRVGDWKKYLDYLWTNIIPSLPENERKNAKLAFYRLLQMTLQKGLDFDIPWSTSINGEQEIDSLAMWIADLGLEEALLYDWADKVNSGQKDFSKEPLQLVLRYCSNQSFFINALKSVWNEHDESLDSYINNFPPNQTRYFCILIQSAAVNNKLGIILKPALERIISWMKVGHKIPGGKFDKFLSDPKMTTQSLTGEEYALLDGMRLVFGVKRLAVVELLPGDNKTFDSYLKELKPFLGDNQEECKSFCNSIYYLLLGLLPTDYDEKRSQKNLEKFCKIMQEFSSEERKWEMLLAYIHFYPPIREAIKQKQTSDDYAKVCQPLICTAQDIEGYQRKRLNWDFFIEILAFSKYPNTADDLWRLIRSLSNYVTQQSNDRLANNFEHRLQMEIIVGNKLLQDPVEKEKYITLLCDYFKGHIAIVYDLVPGLLEFPRGRDCLKEIRGYLSNSDKKLSGR